MRGVIGIYFGVVVTPWKLIGFMARSCSRGAGSCRHGPPGARDAR